MLQKHALLSPAVNAQQAQPSEEAVRSSFEQQFGQMAYEAFSGKYPDLVNSIVTFKILDADLENSVATGAFILENLGEFIYVPVVLSDNQLKPFDIMYVKSKDIFLPLTREWLEEVGKTNLSSMGEGTKLPKTVATDIDIRNIVVPPTTGRYSYASADISPAARLNADASQPLGMRLTKAAAAESGEASQFNPELWAAFTDQFMRIQQMTPGQALDSGTIDLDTLAKMYKSHLKTWDMSNQQAAAPAQAQAAAPALGQGYAPVGANGAVPMQGAAPGMAPLPKMASVRGVQDNGRAMLKHAMQSTEHTLKLPEFLERAPNGVKVGFAKVLDRNPSLLRKAASIYGKDALVKALTPTKTAGNVTRSGGLYIADGETPAPELSASFGSAAPEAFNGVLLRGYYFKDTRPNLNLAVQAQMYHDFHDAQEPGIYRIYNTKGEPKTGLVFTEPLDLLGNPRNVFPTSESKVKRVRNNVQNRSVTFEPGNEPIWNLDTPTPDVERSHRINRMVLFPNGDYLKSTKVMGEQVTEVSVPKDSQLYQRLMRDGTAGPSRGTGIFATKRGAHYLGTCPVEITDLSTGSDGVVRGKLGYPGGMGMKEFVIDPRSPINRPRRMRDTNLVVIPASWKWIPVKEELNAEDFLMTAKGLSSIVLNALGSMGAHEIVARRAGESMYSVNGGPTLEKKAALYKIAADFKVHASAAEAMLKIAEVETTCRAYVVRPAQYTALTERVKIAQGTAAPMTPMGAPPAMAGMQGMDPSMMAAGGMPGAAPSMPPAPPPPSPVDQAFQETTQSLQQQLQQLQGQLDVLMTVQQRAQQIQTGDQGGVPMQGGAPQDMQGGAPQGMGAQPGMGAPQDMGGQPPQGAVMPSEGPSSSEVAAQVNPNFLDASAQFQDAGAFDAGAIASLAQDPSVKRLGSDYAADLENSVDDLGRTLLTLYMQEGALKEQMGDKSFVDLERQLRDTFRGLGSLVLSLTKNTAMLPENAAA